jgi:hypothetical protein
MCNGARLIAISQNQVNVILKIASILPRHIDTRVKIKSSAIKGCILRDLIKGEFIVKGSRIPDCIRTEDDVGELLQIFVSRRAHIHVWEGQSGGKEG